jgi:SAM-dependent methyltransferase
MPLTRDQTRRFYDRLGRRQDWQRYEDRALDVLLLEGGFETARAVFELGCGTGRLAERLLRERLPADARYVGSDLSRTMAGIAGARLSAWPDRAVVRHEDGIAAPVDCPGAFDRFVATYVLDLLSEADIEAALEKAHAMLRPGGLACLVSLTFGVTPASRVMVTVWRGAYGIWPRLLGGCRPLHLPDYLPPHRWRVVRHQVVVAVTVPSEVVIARAIDS